MSEKGNFRAIKTWKPQGPMWNPQPKIIQTGGSGTAGKTVEGWQGQIETFFTKLWVTFRRPKTNLFSRCSPMFLISKTHTHIHTHTPALASLQSTFISHFMRSNDKCYGRGIAVTVFSYLRMRSALSCTPSLYINRHVWIVSLYVPGHSEAYLRHLLTLRKEKRQMERWFFFCTRRWNKKRSFLLFREFCLIHSL